MRKSVLVGLAFGLLATNARAANPSMSSDFGRMMEWLSHEMAQGLAFNAGSLFDPPHEVKSRRLQPDVSLGIGKMPLDKTKFPQPEVPALQEMNAADIFPDSVMFPNLAMHLRAGLPARMDMSIRMANMTTPWRPRRACSRAAWSCSPCGSTCPCGREGRREGASPGSGT